MNTEKLSDRLEMVAHFIPVGSKLADIGSDHAYLPCHLVKTGVIPFAIAGEVVVGPFQSALRQVESEGLQHAISVRLGDGLEVLQQGEVDTVSIAGMGGPLITAILERGKDRLSTVHRLVLQPNIAAESIRKWLIDEGWQLIDEEMIKEDGKIYEILVAEKGDSRVPYGDNQEAELFLGPHLLKKRPLAFFEKWKNEQENWRKILNQLDKATDNMEKSEKKKELLQKILWVEEALKDENSEWS